MLQILQTQRIIPAIDTTNTNLALHLTGVVGDLVEWIKVHYAVERSLMAYLDMFRRAVPETSHLKFWLDTKLDDSRKTVANRAAVAKSVGFDLISVHANAGVDAIAAAVENGPEVVVVTLLSTQSTADIIDLYQQTPEQIVHKLALRAVKGGARKITCPPTLVGSLSNIPELAGLEIIVPGCRSLGQPVRDQRQVDTPYNAARNGAHYMVVGEEILQHENDKLIRETIISLSTEINRGLMERKMARQTA